MKRFLKGILWAVGLLICVQLYFCWNATTSPQWKYAKRALECHSANYDLRYCIDLPADSRKDFTHTTWKPMPCIIDIMG